MTSHEDWFDELIQDPPKHRKRVLITRFLEETIEAVNARYSHTALQTTADFDRFRKRAYHEHDSPTYTKFFTLLSAIIKEFHHEHKSNTLQKY